MHDAVCAVRLCMRVLRVSDYAVCIYLYATCAHLSHPLMKLGSNRKTEDSEKLKVQKVSLLMLSEKALCGLIRFFSNPFREH